MSSSLFELLKYAKTRIHSHDMTQYDKMKALAMFGGITIRTITGIPPISFKADGKPLISWGIAGNMVQDGTPSPDAPITPQELGDLVASGEHAGQYAIPISCGDTQTVYLAEPLRKIGEYADEISSSDTANRKIGNIVFDGTENGWALFSANGAHQFYIGNIISGSPAVNGSSALSNIAPYGVTAANRADYQYGCYAISSGQGIAFQMYGAASELPDVTAWRAYLAEMKAAGTPVAAWYILAEPQTEQITAPTITPAKGSSTLTIGTTLQPSSVSITGHIMQV